jgi:HEAT repeat protein
VRYSQQMDIGWEAAFSLGQMGAPARNVLIEATRQPNATARYHAAYGLTWLRDERAVQARIALLGDPVKEIRILVAIWLGEKKERQAAQALIIALEDPDAEVRGMAARQAIGGSIHTDPQWGPLGRYSLCQWL